MAKEEWGQSGWGGMDDYSKDKTPNDLGRKKFYMKNGETRRLLFCDGMPFRAYFHDTWKINGQHDLYLCLEKNSLPSEHSAKGCALCDAKDWTYFMGWFTVIDMGLVVYENGKSLLEAHKGVKDPSKSYQFMRKLYGAKRGSQEKPGVLQRLHKRAAASGGDLTGTVWDVSREGELAEAVGSDHQFVERIAPADIKRYLLDLGANPETLKTVAPYNYLEEFPIPSYDQLARLARLTPAKRSEPWSDPKGAGY
jgi:hypothetical protein